MDDVDVEVEMAKFTLFLPQKSIETDDLIVFGSLYYLFTFVIAC